MDWIRFSDVSRLYGARHIFEDLSGVLRDDRKVALVGPNGAGKSSLVRILAGLDTPDDGTVIRARDARLGYVGQTASAEQDGTLRGILIAGLARLQESEAVLRRLEEELSRAAAAGDQAAEERAFAAYAAAHETAGHEDVADRERTMRGMLAAFGFQEADLDRPVHEFSGGQRTRAALARMLIDEPDYCILDEPTNHLDVQTVHWLEEFLIADHRAMLVISHDRWFLDRIADEIWELDGGKLERYDVPRGHAYRSYLEQKTERAELARREYENYLAEKKRQKQVIAELRTHGSHNYSHVRSREKQFAKLGAVEAPATSQQQISVRLDASRRATSGLALSVKSVSKAYETPLFTDVSFDLVRGERLVIVGPNGAGKSTLLHILTGSTDADAGTVRIMDGISMASFSQDSAQALPSGVTAVEAVIGSSKVLPEIARGLLGRLGISGDAGDKAVDDFSGGERRRIMLARLMAQSADCLILDEPTNDLDIPSQEALEEVLANYQGALIIVSHDRYLLRRLAEKVLWLEDGGARLIEGGYSAYENARDDKERVKAHRLLTVATPQAKTRVEKKAAHPAPVAVLAPVAVSLPAAAEGEKKGAAILAEREQQRSVVKEISRCEREVAKLDARRAELHLEFADPGVYDDRTRCEALETELADVEAKLESAYERWETLLGGNG